MKKLVLTAFAVSLGLFFFSSADAQKKGMTNGIQQRCGTTERLHLYEQLDPSLTTANQQKASRIGQGPAADNYRLQAIVTVPVVVHIVLPNPYFVTDADVQSQLDRLNLDYSGFNPDSTNATNFYSVRGHSQIQFCLARRTPNGQLTNGVERRFSGTGSDATLNIDPIKRTSMGGLDAWNTSQYLNLWIGVDNSGIGLLGYTDNIGPSSSAADDGVFLNYQGFGTNSCYTMSIYNKGRTAVHEIGHYFGLYHIWGDDNGTCTGDDFAQLPSSATCALPAGLFNPSGQGNTANDVGDTPNQSSETTSCPGGTVLDACSSTAPGKMYQNYMDYTQDACYSMFTKKQVARMEWVLDNCRAGLKTSLGCQPPAGTPSLDVAPIVSVNPGGFETTGSCNAGIYYRDSLSCPGNIAPKFRVINNGLTTVTSLTVGYSYDNGTPVTQNVTVNIAPGATYVASFPAIAVPVGNHTLRFFTSNPNGGTDQVPSNDNFNKTLVVMAPATPPVTEGFETTPFANFAIDNPNMDFTWMRTTPGRNGSAGKLSINNYDNLGYRFVDDFRSTSITVNPSDVYTLSFDLAHRNYPNTNYYDTLAVLVSGDCGQTFTRVYAKAGPALATAGSTDSSYATPNAADWRTEVISLSGSLLSSGKIIVVFRNISGYGNWIHLDNINLVKAGSRDIRVSAINAPVNNVCSGVLNPSVTVENLGTEAVTAFKVGYRIDNGANFTQAFTQTITPGTTATVALPQSITTPGTHTITAYTFEPVAASGTGDLRVSNDTLSQSFKVVNLVSPPLVEGFENAFPPAGWSIVNPNNNVTWTRRSPGNNSNYSAFFDNYNNNVIGQTDDLRTPFVDVAGADSVIVSFDVAHKQYADIFGSLNDRLSVLATNNCATSFTTVYSKAGATLATTGTSSNPYLNPIASDWRTEKIVLSGSLIAPGSLGLAFRNTNDYGNNIFIDNINISSLYKRDIQLVSINQPGTLVCTNSVTPSVTVKNAGIETVTGFKISYSINNAAPVTQTITGISLVRDAQTTVNLAAANNITTGNNSIRVYTFEPVTASGTGDINTRNDTLVKTFVFPATINAPLVQTFDSTAFPPVNWTVFNPDNSFTWQRYNTGFNSAGSAYVNTFNYPALGQKDDLISPVVSYGVVDSVKLSFDLAAATYSYPGSTSVPMDTLEVLVTKDCGNTFITVYKKWGYELQTVNDPNSPTTTEFIPTSSSMWRRENIDLTAFASQSPLIVFFRVTNNFENNIFIDNVNLATRNVPDKLKQAGYLLMPSPFHDNFTVWHYQTPTALQYIRVMNAAGQTLLIKQFNGNAGKQETIDLTGKAAGIYFVELGYSQGRHVQKIVKY